jgi:hypothetical protein
MRKYGLGFGSQRFYVLTLSVTCLLFGVSAAHVASAQVASSSLVATNSNTSTNPTPEASSMESFADVAALGQEIALAQRKIQAMTLKNNLDALQAQQNMGNFSLKVIRVEGLGDSLYAILTDDSGAIYQVAPGDLVNKQYRVTSLRPYSVGVVDVNTQKFSIVPFQTGGVVSNSGGSDPSFSASASSSAPHA